MKKTIGILLACILCLAPMLSACHRDEGVKINTTMTQLYVGNCANGYGTEWLSEISADFEELYKDYSFETGKKGVQIVPSTDGYDGTTLLNNIASSDVDVILKRKGDVGAEPDFRRHVHSISDYNWSAAFTLLFLICAR